MFEISSLRVIGHTGKQHTSFDDGTFEGEGWEPETKEATQMNGDQGEHRLSGRRDYGYRSWRT
jgi:hypothetical protein